MFARLILCTWGVLLFCLPVVADAQPKCKIAHYTTEDGMSSDRVTSITRDSEGFMWFGTWDGINRFDGHSFVTYKSYPGDLSKLKNDRIDEIIEDKTVYLWLKDYDKQVYRFDKKTEQFLPLSDILREARSQKLNFDRIISNDKGTVWLLTHDQGVFFIPNTALPAQHYIRYEQNLGKPYRLPSNQINFFYQDQRHTVWIGTPHGLAQLVKDSTGSYINSSAAALSPAPGMNLNFTGVTEDAQNVYFCTAEGYFIAYNKDTRTARHVLSSAGRLNNICVSLKHPLVYCSTASGQVVSIAIADLSISPTGFKAAEPVYAMHEDPTGCLWIEPSVAGIFRFDPSTGLTNKYTQQPDAYYGYANAHPKVYEDNNGTVWASLKNCGFGYYNASSRTFEYFYNGPDPATHRFSNMVTGIYYDKAGVLWLSTDSRGVDKIIFPGNHFDQYLPAGNSTFRTDNEVRGIYTDRKNRLWTGTKGSRLYVTQAGKPVAIHFTGDTSGGMGSVYSILQDHTGTVWLGTKQNGLFKAEPTDNTETTYSVSHYKEDEKDPYSILGNDVYTLAEDKAGRIWAGTFDKGLNQVVTANHHTTFINTKNSYQQYPQNAFNKIRHLAFDKEGNIWVGTTSGLLVVEAAYGKDPARTRFITYSKVPGDKESLGSNNVQFVFKDAHNTMWLSTAGGGLCRCTGEDPFKGLRFKNYTVSDGLPNNYLLSCLEDHQGHLWLSTQNGISRFTSATGQFRNYDSDDGLAKSEFSEGSCTRLQDGSLVFGTIKGYLVFNPEKIIDPRIDARIVFTNLQVNNQNRISGDKDSILSGNINYTDNLQLQYDQNNISIDYTVLDYRSAGKQDYAYRLKGFDTVWHSNQLQRRATYTNLAPGHYVFEVRSLQQEQYLHLPAKSLAITILPPPWRTWWAYLLYVLLAIVIIEIVRRNGLAILRLRHRIAVEQQLTELKLRFFTNVSHELRTPLTLIVNPIQEIAQKEHLSLQGEAHIALVQKNAARMVRFINQLLDLRKVQSGKAVLKVSKVDIISFVKNISEYFTQTAQEKQIGLEIIADVEEIPIFIDAEKIDIVIYNLLANAFKFSPSGTQIQVRIRQSLEKGIATIEVSDEGKGVPEKMLKDIFELYFEEDNSGSNNTKGTGIGLALSKELVALHHGRIAAQNNVQQGLTVTIILPLGIAHFQKDEIQLIDLPDTLQHHLLKSPVTVPAYESRQEDTSAADLPLLLLVEDNMELQAFLRNQLSSIFRVEVAANGEEGLQKAESMVPDLILSDVMMPKMDGIKMLAHLKNMAATSHIPVVLLSARSSVENQLEGLRYGADLYITKPFNNDLLLASLDNLLNQRKKLFEWLSNHSAAPIELNPTTITITPKDELFLKQVIAIVEEKMADADFNIDSVAESINMGRSTFYKKFKSLTHLPPVEFIRDMRLKRSIQYMDAGETNITTIAYAVGFNNAKYFSTCFREKFQLTPTEYLKTTVKEVDPPE